jgi:hypothetical protein
MATSASAGIRFHDLTSGLRCVRQIFQISMAFFFGKDPEQRVFEISEDSNTVLTHSFSQILKRSRESIGGIATNNEGSMGIRREYIGLSQLAHVLRAQIESHNVRKVQ